MVVLHALGWGLFCFILWLLLSGYFTPLLLAFGVLSAALAVLMVWREEVINPDEKALRLLISPYLWLRYWPWLLWQIIKANIDVSKRILDPALPISPTVVSLKLPQDTDLAQVIYANSITLTPGTVTTYLRDGVIEVHALTEEAAAELLEGEMGRRVSELEGRL